jgi:hypothetical protein
MSKEKLIQGLNEDLSAELGTVIRYTYQEIAADEAGHGRELRRLLKGL